LYPENINIPIQSNPIYLFHKENNKYTNRYINIMPTGHNNANSENELCYISANRAQRQRQPCSNRSPKRKKIKIKT